MDSVQETNSLFQVVDVLRLLGVISRLPNAKILLYNILTNPWKRVFISMQRKVLYTY